MSYEVTATRKRPQTFDELTGQEFVVSTLKNSITSGRIAHAYLFSGPRGVGKTSAARILAKALNCETGPTDTPCGDCTCCTEIAKGVSLDVIEIDGASNTSVNDVREIKDEVLFAPNSLRYKIYIIDEVHMLSNSAFNALLKTIEEPPPYIVFIFATTEIHKVPATIRSRCQQFNFRLIPADAIVAKLEEITAETEMKAEKDALYWIAKESTGSLRDAYTLYDQVVAFSEEEITIAVIRDKLGLVGFERINELAEIFAEGNVQNSLEKVNEILQSGVSVEQFVIDLTEYFRNLLFIQAGIRRQAVLGYAPEGFSQKCVEIFSAEQLEFAVQQLFQLFRNIRFSLSPRYELELVISKLSNLQQYLSNTTLVRELYAMKQQLISGGVIDEGTAVEQETRTDGKHESGGPAADAVEEVPWNDIISRVKKTKVALSSVLSKVKQTELTDNTLTIYFPTAYAANSVREDIQTVAAVAEEVIGRQVSIKIETSKVSENPKDQIRHDEQVEVLKKVFKGEIVEGG
jgi:DNA polymerase III subunit gamma/tau